MKKLIFSLLFLFSAACAFSQYDFYTQTWLAGQAMMQQFNAQQQAQFQQMNSNFWSNYQAGQQANNYNQGSLWEQANRQSQSTNYNSNTSNNSNSTSNSSTNTSNSSTEKQQSKRWHVETEWVDCFSCHGSGRCRTCDGKGWHWGSLGLDKLLCPNCTNHDGVCIHCGGKGKRPKEKREYY